ncbi:MAG: hypothetical protein ACOYOK_08920 [Pseudobdellovibrionaceae bacterium]
MLKKRNAYFILVPILMLLSGCSLFDSFSTKSAQPKLHKRIFLASYDNVWRATHSALRYPIAIDNQDTGVIETEMIKAVDGWTSATAEQPPPSGLKYKLVILIVKGKVDGQNSTRVSIEKKSTLSKDFFSDPELIDSDGLEEKSIFYRIERELVIMNVLKKAT